MDNLNSSFTVSKAHNISLRALKIKKGYSLFLDIHFQKKRYKEYLRLYISTNDKKHYTHEDRNSIKIAEYIKAQRFLEISKGTYRKTKESEFLSFTDYLEFIKESKFEENDKGKYKWSAALLHLNRFTDNKVVKFDRITIKFLEDFKIYLKANLKQVTAADVFSTIGSALKKAYREDIIVQNPMDKINKIPRIHASRIFLTYEELKILNKTECGNEEVKKGFLFCCFTGLRYSDVRALKWEQIKSESGKHVLYFTQQKTKTPVRVFIAKQAIEYLGERNSDDKLVFKILEKHHTNRHLKEWAERAGINKHVTFHVSRHTFATLALTYGVDIKTVSELLGHSEVRTTEIYAKIIDKKKEDAVLMLPEL